MANTLTNGTTVLTLPDDLMWPDEFSWSAVQAQRSYSVAGALLIDRGVKLAGRPITLQAGVDYAWATRSVALTLFSWVQQANPALTLSYRGTSYPVDFDRAAQPLEVTQVLEYSNPNTTDSCVLTLRFITLG